MRRHFPKARNPWLLLNPALMLAAMATGAYFYFALFAAPQGAFRLCAGAQQQECVVDGGTLRHDGMIIRLADIDAPATNYAKCAAEAALGKRAAQRLLDLMNAGPFTVVRAGERDEDDLGRKLRVVERGGRSVSEALIAEGLAMRRDGPTPDWCG